MSTAAGPNLAARAGPAESPPRRKERGLTLIQLLVVLGIVAVLIGMVIPVVGLARSRANLFQCQSNLRQLSLALLLYASDNEGWFPAAASLYLPASNDWVYWQPTRNLAGSAIAPYVGSFQDGAILRCPCDDWASRTTNPNPAYPPYPFSYSLNEWVSPNSSSPSLALPALPLSAMKHTADIILVVDESSQTLDDGMWAAAGGNWLAIRHDSPGIVPDTVPQAGYPLPNPARRGNAAFLDGHADFVQRNYAHNPAHFDPHQ